MQARGLMSSWRARLRRVLTITDNRIGRRYKKGVAASIAMVAPRAAEGVKWGLAPLTHPVTLDQ
jgi:hypothetical protein